MGHTGKKGISGIFHHINLLLNGMRIGNKTNGNIMMNIYTHGEDQQIE